MANNYKNFDICDLGYVIKCKLYCNNIRDLKNVILYGHGFGGHKDNKACERFAGHVLSKYKKTGIMAFDWPCHGDDIRKKLSLDDCSGYVASIIDYIREKLSVNEIFAYGTSFGGYLFLKYIQENSNPFVKLAFRCPAVNMHNIIMTRLVTENDMLLLEKGKEAAIGYDRKVLVGMPFLNELKEADITKLDYMDYADDILIIHGTKDEVVPIEPVREFAENNVIELIEMQDADHRFKDIVKMDKANSLIMEFFFG